MTKTQMRRTASAVARTVSEMTLPQVGTWYLDHVGYDVVADATASDMESDEVAGYCRAAVASAMFFRRVGGASKPGAEATERELEVAVLAGRRSL